MKKIFAGSLVFLGVAAAQAVMTNSPWMPLFKGVELSVGTNSPDATHPRYQSVRCLRVDLTDPDVQLFSTPPASNYVAESRETLSLTVSNFLKNYGLKVAADANFYRSNPGGGDAATEGVPTEVYGLQISTGAVVSVADTGLEFRYCSLLFTTNKEALFAFDNRPPGTNTEGIYTAITGYYPVLTNGAIVDSNYLAATYPDSWTHRPQPRTAFGVSQDGRYLFLMTIDGRQGRPENVNPPFSEGAVDEETGEWMLNFGAWNAINMDGGGSTAMYMADCAGNPVPLNHSSYVAANHRERNIGSHLGVSAKPLPAFIYEVTVTPGATNALLAWNTEAEASSQVDYGTAPGSLNANVSDLTPVTNHTLTLTDLAQGTKYYFRITSATATDSYTFDSCSPFSTTNITGPSGLLFGLTQVWKYATNNLDGVPWNSPGYDDSAWTNGPGLLYIENSTSVSPRNTLLPPPVPGPFPGNYPYITYYFRTHFTFTNDPAGATLIFSNYLDDGAVFYLNGVEIQRAFMPLPPAIITNRTLATGSSCPPGNDATCPYVFPVSGALATNLVQGDNVVAVELHNVAANSADVVFGNAIIYVLPVPAPPPPPFIANVTAAPGETGATITWTTLSNATSQVEYGVTPSLGTLTPLDGSPVTNHSVALTGLLPLTPYYFRVLSSAGSTLYASNGTFATVPFYRNLLALTNTWRYTTNNLDGLNWQSPAFDDSAWPSGPALLWVDQDPNPNPAVQPKYTQMPFNLASGYPLNTYYFRTHFNVSDPLPGLSLACSNLVDDGAVLYLNGTEIQRLRMPPAPQPITSDTSATGEPAGGDAVTAEVFRLSGEALGVLAAGDNVLAVEVHNVSSTSSDITFGAALGLVRALVTEARLRVQQSNDVICVSWDGTGFTLQQSQQIEQTNSWSDLPGPVQTSPFCVGHPSTTTFYRLRN